MNHTNHHHHQKMPKRSIDEVKAAAAAAAAPISALAARRLRSQVTVPVPEAEAEPAPPAAAAGKTTKKPKKRKAAAAAAPAAPEQEPEVLDTVVVKVPEVATVVVEEEEEARAAADAGEDIAAKRREIEEKLRAQVRAQTRARAAAAVQEYGNTSLDDSALARIRVGRKSADAVDEEMADAGELTEGARGFEDDVEVMSEVDDRAANEEPVQISTFVPNDGNYVQSQDGLTSTFRLISGETLAILGEYILEVVFGSIELYGATLTKESGRQTVYAPSTGSLPVIECNKLKSNAREEDQQFDAEIVVTGNGRKSGLADIGQTAPMFGGIWSPARTKAERMEENCSFFPLFTTTCRVSTIDTLPRFESVYDTLIQKNSPETHPTPSPPSIIITGSKGAGKSTFCRTLINKLLTSTCAAVAFLDVDPGQPEFTTQGFVSLHRITKPVFGSQFTHPNPDTVVRAHYIGYNSPQNDPAHYISCIINLIATYRENLESATSAGDARAPLIINTAGWTKGLGLELLGEIIYNAQASDLVHIAASSERFNPILEIVPPNVALYELVSVAGDSPSRYTASDLRALQTTSYMHHRPEKGDWDFVTPLTAVAPWVVPYTGPEAGVDGITVLGESVTPDELVTAVDGTLVGVVLVEEHVLPQAVAAPGSGLPWLREAPAPESSFAAGLALIRAVDAGSGCLQLLTGIREADIAGWEGDGLKVVLVRGSAELPVWDMLGAFSGDAPWVHVGAIAGKGGIGAGVWRFRKNVMRRQYTTGGRP